MDSQNQKWVNLSFFALAALVAYVLYAAGVQIAALYDLETRIRSIDLILRVGSIAILALLFFLLWRNDRANQYTHEVVVELGRVTWPTQKDTASATFIVIVMVLISGVVLGLLDYVWTKLLQMIL